MTGRRRQRPVLSRGSLQTSAGGTAGARLADERRASDGRRACDVRRRRSRASSVASRARGSRACARRRDRRRRPREVERARGEDACSRRRLVVRHLRRHARAEEVRDLREHLDAARRAGRDRSISTPPRPNGDPRRRPVPAKIQRPRRMLGRSTAARRRCRSRGTGRRSAPPPGGRGRASSRVFVTTSPSSLDPPEEVVRGEEHEVAAEIAEPLDEVVLAASSRTRGGPAKTMRSYARASASRARDALEVGLREVVDLLAASSGARQERQVVTRKPYGHAAARGTAGRAGRVFARLPAYQESAAPSPSSSRRLYACHVSVGRTTATRCSPSRRGADDERCEADASVRALGGGRSRGRSPSAPTRHATRPAVPARRRSSASPSRERRSSRCRSASAIALRPDRKICSVMPRARFEITSVARRRPAR